MIVLAVVGAISALHGCKLKPPPDPNDPSDVGVVQADVLERSLQWASTAVNERVARGEISDEEGRRVLAQEADRLLRSVKIDLIEPVHAWKYGDLFRTAKWWDQAERAYLIAVEHARRTKNEDRRVNDSLRLAQAQAQLGDVGKAIATARSVFDARPEDKAPILLSVLYEIVPAAEGKMRDKELAQLLCDAIAQHDAVIVDPNSEPGKAFLAARMHHCVKAWTKAIELFERGGDRENANRARIALQKLRQTATRL